MWTTKKPDTPTDAPGIEGMIEAEVARRTELARAELTQQLEARVEAEVVARGPGLRNMMRQELDREMRQQRDDVELFVSQQIKAGRQQARRELELEHADTIATMQDSLQAMTERATLAEQTVCSLIRALLPELDAPRNPARYTRLPELPPLADMNRILAHVTPERVIGVRGETAFPLQVGDETFCALRRERPIPDGDGAVKV